MVALACGQPSNFVWNAISPGRGPGQREAARDYAWCGPGVRRDSAPGQQAATQRHRTVSCDHQRRPPAHDVYCYYYYYYYYCYDHYSMLERAAFFESISVASMLPTCLFVLCVRQMLRCRGMRGAVAHCACGALLAHYYSRRNGSGRRGGKKEDSGVPWGCARFHVCRACMTLCASSARTCQFAKGCPERPCSRAVVAPNSYSAARAVGLAGAL